MANDVLLLAWLVCFKHDSCSRTIDRKWLCIIQPTSWLLLFHTFATSTHVHAHENAAHIRLYRFMQRNADTDTD